jgi:hypothetical protein
MTLEEVQNHINEGEYSRAAFKAITFFLLGAEMIDKPEDLQKPSEWGEAEFEDFYDWYYTDFGDPLDDYVTITDAEGHEMTIPLRLITSILREKGFTVDKGEGATDCSSVLLEGYSPLLEGWVQVAVDADQAIGELRKLGYETKLR